MKRILLLFMLMGLNAFSQQAIYVSVDGGNIYSVDLINCNYTFVGSTNHGFGDIAATPDGRLWGIEGGEIYEINTHTAATTYVGYSGLQGVSLVALDNNTLLIENKGELLGFHLSDMSNYYIGHIGYQADGDLTWYDHDLYMLSGGLVIKIVLNATNTAITSLAPVNSLPGTLLSFEGTTTASFPGTDDSIIGFAGADAYRICQINGHKTFLCSLVGTVTGGAAVRLPIQNPEPVICPVLGIISPENNLVAFEIYPNPFSKETVLHSREKLDLTTLKIYNSLGQLVRQSENHSWNTITIPRDNLSNGIYYLHLTENDILLMKSKLVISNQ